MNEEIALAVIDAELQRLRALSYSELAVLVGMNEKKEVRSEDAQPAANSRVDCAGE